MLLCLAVRLMLLLRVSLMWTALLLYGLLCLLRTQQLGILMRA